MKTSYNTFHKAISHFDKQTQESLFNQFQPDRLQIMQVKTRQFCFAPSGELLCYEDIIKKDQKKR